MYKILFHYKCKYYFKLSLYLLMDNLEITENKKIVISISF